MPASTSGTWNSSPALLALLMVKATESALVVNVGVRSFSTSNVNARSTASPSKSVARSIRFAVSSAVTSASVPVPVESVPPWFWLEVGAV